MGHGIFGLRDDLFQHSIDYGCEILDRWHEETRLI
jgi:hypothetical protein